MKKLSCCDKVSCFTEQSSSCHSTFATLHFELLMSRAEIRLQTVSTFFEMLVWKRVGGKNLCSAYSRECHATDSNQCICSKVYRGSRQTALGRLYRPYIPGDSSSPVVLPHAMEKFRESLSLDPPTTLKIWDSWKLLFISENCISEE